MTTTLDLRQAIPGYSLEQRIGAGGYGEVWRAEAPGGLLKAVKIVFGYVDGDQALREMKALQRVRHVRHPFLLSLERIDVVDCRLVIVTELADGSLKDRFDACRAEGLPGIPREELLGYLHDAADAFDYMSDQHGLQHLDVKPENLLLVGGRIKVADFGLVKDLQDPRVSMPAGLTPMYAPPEIFHGTPSTHSDQYSLAIVYQEMLTGLLPFPGKTAAQLAAQHLTAAPRLRGLSTAEQQVIGRALSKDPRERFARCRELVDALAACQAAPAQPSQASRAAHEEAAAGGDRRTQSSRALGGNFGPTAPLGGSATPGATGPLPTAPGPFRPGSAEGGGEESSGSLSDPFDPSAPTQLSEGELSEEPRIGARVPRRVPSPRVTVEPAPEAVALEPGGDLVLGIGGIGGRVLRAVRGLESAGSAAGDAESPRRFLLIDTDAHALMEATGEEDAHALRPEETCHAPIRRAQHYRAASAQLLSWLSRRWLYNIPRSLLTEGRRPLGRLALCDHAEELKRALVRAWDSVPGIPPARVWIVASTGGGTGSGMAADLTQWVEELARQRGVPAAIRLLLIHATPRQPAARDLASANALAALLELQHTRAARSQTEGSVDSLDSVHVWTLSDEPGREGEGGLDDVARFLHLEGCREAAERLEACRRRPPNEEETPAPPSSAPLRTFQWRNLLGRETPPLDRLATELVRDFLLDWGAVRAENGSRPIAPRGGERAERQIDMLGLRSDTILRRIAGMLDQAGAAPLDAALQQVILQWWPRQSPAAVVAEIEALVEGRVRGESDARRGGGARAQAWAGDTASQLAQWTRQLIASFDDGPGVAWAAFRDIAEHLQQLKDSISQLSEEHGVEVEQLAARLTAEPELAATRNTRQRKTREKEIQNGLLEFAQQRALLASLQGAYGYLHALQAQLQPVQEELRLLRQPLVNVLEMLENRLTEFPVNAELPSLTRAIPAQFAKQRETLLAQLAEGIAAAVAASGTPMQQWLTAVDPANLGQRLLDAAEQVVTRAAIAWVAEAIASDSSTPESQAVRAAIEDAFPALALRCGGVVTRFLIAPREHLAAFQVRGSEAAVLAGPADQPLALCCEAAWLPAEGVAAEWTDARPDLAQAAAQLHTRIDIAWAPFHS